MSKPVQLFLGAAVFLAVFFFAIQVDAADPVPDAKAILNSVRQAQAEAPPRTLKGQLRCANKTTPFILSTSGNTISWEFTSEPKQKLTLRLGERDARLEEEGKGKVTPARFDDPVRDTDLTYEDLSMRFLYWPDPKIEGDQIISTQSCWIISVTPPSGSGSQYARAKLWIGKNTGALMQAECLNAEGKLARKFNVRSGQKADDGAWILKTMRIEAPVGKADRTPTYLEID